MIPNVDTMVPNASSGAGMSIGGAVVGGTAPSILFIGAGSVLAQDPTNFGYDSTNKALLIEGSPAIFRVPNASGNNWFEDNAGNFTVTGYLNFGTGDNCLASLTTGIRNTGYGNGALFACTSGFDNFGIGFQALAGITTGDSNVGVGTFVMDVGQTLSNNVGLGFGALRNLGSAGGTPFGNVCIGSTALTHLQTGNANVGIGYNVASVFTSGTNNVFVGQTVLNSATGTNASNTIVGSTALVNATSANQCTVLGLWTGPAVSFSNIIAFIDGSNPTSPHLDWGYTNSNIWSFHQSTNPQGLRVYNTFDQVIPTVNYERFCFDWTLTSNIARIASQAGGTGTVRIIAIDGFQKAGAPAPADLPSGTWGLINDTSGNATWLCYNNSGTIRKVQLV